MCIVITVFTITIIERKIIFEDFNLLGYDPLMNINLLQRQKV